MTSPTCANPLLLGWIKELYDQALERNTKGVTTYRKAYNSMKACPLTFSHPSEAQQLDGIGTKICDILIDKLKEHCEANGLPAPKKARGKARKRFSAEDLGDVEEPAPVKRPRKAKPYVPSLRSGPYAVILALSSLPEDSFQSLTKVELIELAQPHCDSSFTVPSEAGKFYTAWNSMKTLLEKDLVHERGRPLRKYALTDEGWEVARRIRAAQRDETSVQTRKHRTTERPKEKEATGVFGKIVRASSNVHGFLDLEGDSEPENPPPKPNRDHDVQGSVEEVPTSSGQRLGGAPVDKYGTFAKAMEPKPKRQEAASRYSFVDLSSNPEPQPTIGLPWESSTFTQDSRKLSSRQQEPFQPKFAQAMCMPPATSSSLKPLSTKTRPPSSPPFQPSFAQAINAPSATACTTQQALAMPRTMPRPSSSEPFQPNFAQAMNGPSTSHSSTKPSITNFSSTKPPTKSKTSSIELSQPIRARATNDPSAGDPSTKPSTKSPPPVSSAFPTFAPIHIRPGSFTVHLVLDNREVRTRDDRDYISEELTKKGAKPLVRPLELGDFFWVAKMQSPSLLAQYGEEGDEIALDWIVERKRLDDLVGSITDGRFQEQKFRLRRSGVKNVIYLIEEFSISSEKATKFHEAIQSAIASTQVVNGYFVKQTRKLDDTIRYLARMTRMLKGLYESKPLYLIPTSALTPTTYLPFLTHLRTHPSHKDKSYHISYPSFASLSSKSDTLTLRDVYLKMLMCTRGISGDKALAIQKQWTTPRAFIEAFEACGSQKEREALVESRLGGIVGRGKVKGVLGAKVAAVWGEE